MIRSRVSDAATESAAALTTVALAEELREAARDFDAVLPREGYDPEACRARASFLRGAADDLQRRSLDRQRLQDRCSDLQERCQALAAVARELAELVEHHCPRHVLDGEDVIWRTNELTRTMPSFPHRRGLSRTAVLSGYVLGDDSPGGGALFFSHAEEAYAQGLSGGAAAPRAVGLVELVPEVAREACRRGERPVGRYVVQIDFYPAPKGDSR